MNLGEEKRCLQLFVQVIYMVVCNKKATGIAGLENSVLQLIIPF